ncbi:MAG: hypothetical protein R2754_17170 [Microthrixaceae bacterium]
MTARPARPLIVPGGQRCGSTWLVQWLAGNPSVGLREPVRPEPKVFLDAAADADMWWRRCLPPTWDRPRELQPAGELAAADRWVIEKSTSYLERPEVVDRIQRHLAGARVLVVLRDPVERAISNWRFSVANGRETRDAEVALRPGRADGRCPPAPESTDTLGPPSTVQPHRYLERGHYAELLTPWIEAFGTQVFVAFLEELRSQPEARGSLLDFLGVERRIEPTTKLTPIPAAANASTGDPRVAEVIRPRLRRYYAPGIEPLERLLGRRVPWQLRADASDARRA